MARKFLFIFSLLITIAFTDLSAWDPDYNYDKYMEQFGRNYTGDERIQHEKIFWDNYNDLLQQRKDYGRDVAVNNFTDWNHKQRAKFFNYHPQDAKIPFSSTPGLTKSTIFRGPASYDWRSLNRVTPIKNQGQCGSCWSFSSTAQYESAYAIATNGTLLDLAEQYGVQCDNRSSGCNGGWPINTLRLFNSTGIPPQSLYPYREEEDTYYPKICVNTTGRIRVNKNISGIYNFNNLTDQEIEDNLFNYGPLGIAVHASNRGFNPGRSGQIICNMSQTIRLDHAILLYGYNTTHWFIKNSWGTGWGSQGYAFIRKDANCGLNRYVDVMQFIYNQGPTPPPPVPTNITLSISMTDSYGDGWQGNEIGFRQNGVIVGSFGKNFTNGFNSTASVTINGRLQTQIVVSVLGSSTSEVQFVIRFPNNTIAFNKTRSTFGAQFIFFTFCPSGGCPRSTISLSVLMLDSYGDGWQRTVLGFKQNNVIVATFGESFTNQSRQGPVTITIPGMVPTQIVVSQMGGYPEEVGFDVTAPNGTLIFRRVSGQAFNATTIFTQFCPLGSCPLAPTVRYFIILKSTCSGWGKTVLGVRQAGKIIARLNLRNGTVSSPIPVILNLLVQFQIVVLTLGERTWQIGFEIRTQVGTIIGERVPGTAFAANQILFQFTPGLSNQGYVSVTQEFYEYQRHESLQNESQDLYTQKQKKLLVAVIILAVFGFAMTVAFAISLIKNINMKKERKDEMRSQVESANTINKQVK